MTESWAKLWGFKITFTGQRRERRWRGSCQKYREKTRNVIEIKRWGAGGGDKPPYGGPLSSDIGDKDQ